MIVYVISVHFAQYSLSPVAPVDIVVTASPVKSSLSYHPPNVYPVRIGVGNVIGKSESVYSDGATTPVGNAPEFKLNVIVYEGTTH